MNRVVDHIVFCVADLDEAIDHIKSLLGIRPVFGGYHKNKGTKNALLNLGNKCYLELLAIDDTNTDFKGDRWMGIDMLDGPKITRWSLKSNDLEKDSDILSQKSQNLSQIIEGSRETSSGKLLSWSMIAPYHSPEIEVLPFMTDWSKSDIHPADSLEEGCKLNKVYLFHPKPEEVMPFLSQLGVDIVVKEGDEMKIEIEIMSPNGVTFLS